MKEGRRFSDYFSKRRRSSEEEISCGLFRLPLTILFLRLIFRSKTRRQIIPLKMKLLTETSAALLSNGAKMEVDESKRIVWKLVLTGGPCGGKTTGQARLSTFFENLGWKVYRVPEMATVIIRVKSLRLKRRTVFNSTFPLIT